MSDLQQDIQQVTLDIEEAKKHVAHQQALANLEKNPDFKLLIEDNYFIQEASRLVLLKAAQQMEAEDSQTRIDKQINAIGNFRQYLVFINAWGAQAKEALKEHQATLDSLREEEVI